MCLVYGLMDVGFAFCGFVREEGDLVHQVDEARKELFSILR